MPALPPCPSTRRRYASTLILVTFCFVTGTFLFMAPWNFPVPLFSYLWDGVWENNYFVIRYPGFRSVMSNPFLKGAISGLGLVNLLIGIYLVGEKLRK